MTKNDPEELFAPEELSALEELSDSATAHQTSHSIWAVKPWWCQPWSIILTGLCIPTVSWLLLHRLWLTIPIAGIILLWWVLFLVLVPAQYAKAMSQNTSNNV